MDIDGLILGFIYITFLGLLIMFNPSLTILNLFLVLKSKRPIRDTLTLVAGVTLSLIILTLISILWLRPDRSFNISGFLSDVSLPPLFNVLLGLSLMVYATLHYSRGRKSVEGSAFADKAQRIIVSPASIFSFGFIRATLSITNLLAVLAISKIIIVNDLSTLMSFFVLGWCLVIGLAPLLTPPFLHTFAPKYLKNAQVLIDKLLAKNTNTAINILLALIGLGFFVHGITQLRGGN